MPRVSKPQSDKTPLDIAAATLRAAFNAGTICPTCGHRTKGAKLDEATTKALRSFIASPRVSVYDELVTLAPQHQNALGAYRKVYIAENFSDV
jgi:hypothetical protein